MTNIVERLRDVAAMDLRTGGFLAHTLDTAKEAADEIERLREALTTCRELRGLQGASDSAEIERLRALVSQGIAKAEGRTP